MTDRVEQTIIKRSDPRWSICDDLSWRAKNVYNSALYTMRKSFFSQDNLLSAYEVSTLFANEDQPDFRALPAKVSQAIINQVSSSFKSFFTSLKSPKVNHKVSLPSYKNTKNGRAVVPFNNQTVKYQRKVREDLYEYSILPRVINLRFYSTRPNIKWVNIVPRHNCYVLELVYSVNDTPLIKSDNLIYMGIDLGVNNIAACIVTTGQSFVVNGRPIKSINQYYNKTLAQLKSRLPKGVYSSKAIHHLHLKRNNKMMWELHNVSRHIVNQAVSSGVTDIVIGKNPYWKQDTNMGKRNNQTFVSIPHAKLIKLITYKAEEYGITVHLTEESYTSQASFLSGDAMPVYPEPPVVGFSGTRKGRLYKDVKKNLLLNADVNGAANIIRKVAPNVSIKGVEDAVVRPRKVTVKNVTF